AGRERAYQIREWEIDKEGTLRERRSRGMREGQTWLQTHGFSVQATTLGWKLPYTGCDARSDIRRKRFSQYTWQGTKNEAEEVSGVDVISKRLRNKLKIKSSEYDALLQKITELKELVQRQHREGAPVVRPPRERVQQRQQQQQRAQQPRGFRVGQHKAPPVGFDRDDQRAKPFCGRCKKQAKVRRITSTATAPAYGPPAVLCAGAVGGIDVSAYGFTVEQQPASEGDDILRRLDDLAAEVHSAANPQVHYTHASFPPPDGIEQQASALGKDVEPAPLQSARVTTTTDADGEFAGFVQTVNHAAIGQVDLTGYDTDDYEDLADCSFIVKPRTPAVSANHVSEPATHVPVSGGASRTYGCGKPPWGVANLCTKRPHKA
ncbi:hypothetical protein CYMTET_41946, partial [Cymbomonas tetramitiformis]